MTLHSVNPCHAGNMYERLTNKSRGDHACRNHYRSTICYKFFFSISHFVHSSTSTVDDECNSQLAHIFNSTPLFQGLLKLNISTLSSGSVSKTFGLNNITNSFFLQTVWSSQTVQFHIQGQVFNGKFTNDND